MPMTIPVIAPLERCDELCFSVMEVLDEMFPGVPVADCAPVPVGEEPPTDVVGLALDYEVEPLDAGNKVKLGTDEFYRFQN
jgi:hypothetical protein